jgi:hypothetical protein
MLGNRNYIYVYTYCNKFKWPEDDSLRVEICSHMKFIIIYIYIYIYIYI